MKKIIKIPVVRVGKYWMLEEPKEKINKRKKYYIELKEEK